MWVELVNISLKSGSMESLKSAVISPLIKDMDNFMDCDIYKNYRPVSNLQFLGTPIERVVSIRLNKHMTDNNLHSKENHAYKKEHSSETLLVEIVNDLLLSCDDNTPTILLLLDLSAAFDTIDQKILLEILQNEIGIIGTAFDWFKSFITQRSQRVKIGDYYSAITILIYGVAQGSILGPILFKIYIRSLYYYINPALYKIFGFADDHQIMKKFVPLLQINALHTDISRYINLISKWMNSYFLSLNPSKTKILVIMPPSLKKRISIHGTFINGQCIRFVSSAKNLEVIIDDELSFDEQIHKVSKSCFNTIQKLSKIKFFLTQDHLKTILTTCILSRLDYCNSLYYGINSALLDKLQSVQNMCL